MNSENKMSTVDASIKENNLQEQITIFEKSGKLLVKTSDEFNTATAEKQNQIVTTVVDILLKSNKTDTMFSVGLNEDGEINMKVFDTFNILSLQSQEQILRNLSMVMKKMSEVKEMEKIENSQWLN